MPTEVTTEATHKVSGMTESLRVLHNAKVIEADRTDARQTLSKNEEVLPPARESSQVSNEQLEEVADSLNQHVQNLKRDLHFSINEDTSETIIRVVDSASQKTIRTIPSDEFLSLQQQLNQSVGLLLNAQV